jgi:hypothetical protein
LIANGTGGRVLDAFALETKHPEGVRALRHAHGHLARDGGHANSRSQYRLLERHRHFEPDIGALAAEVGIGLYAQARQRITGRGTGKLGITLVREADRLAIADSCGDDDLDRVAVAQQKATFCAESGIEEAQLLFVGAIAATRLKACPFRRSKTGEEAAEQLFGRGRAKREGLEAKSFPLGRRGRGVGVAPRRPYQ